MSVRPMVSIFCSPPLMVLAMLFTLFSKPESSMALAVPSLTAIKSVALRSQLKIWNWRNGVVFPAVVAARGRAEKPIVN